MMLKGTDLPVDIAITPKLLVLKELLKQAQSLLHDIQPALASNSVFGARIIPTFQSLAPAQQHFLSKPYSVSETEKETLMNTVVSNNRSPQDPLTATSNGQQFMILRLSLSQSSQAI